MKMKINCVSILCFVFMLFANGLFAETHGKEVGELKNGKYIVTANTELLNEDWKKQLSNSFSPEQMQQVNFTAFAIREGKDNGKVYYMLLGTSGRATMVQELQRKADKFYFLPGAKRYTMCEGCADGCAPTRSGNKWYCSEGCGENGCKKVSIVTEMK